MIHLKYWFDEMKLFGFMSDFQEVLAQKPVLYSLDSIAQSL